MEKRWWREGVVYQIYPRSFADSNGDGIGDLRGIIGRLDYLQTLGVAIIWLSPVYKSPNDDNGYDISDYQAINSEFGSLADWQELLAGLHQRGMKLLMDLVVNHTSDEHPWFVAARSSKASPYRDYYIWRPSVAGQEPNNWSSFFSGSAWAYDEATDEYYLHLFSQKQPDLNWENPKLRAEIYAMMRWWLDKGIDGFRMDVINMLSKAPGLPDAPGDPAERYHFPGEYAIHGPRLGEFLAEMRREVLDHYDLLTVGEMPTITPERAAAITHAEHGQLSMVFQFEHVDLDVDSSQPLGKWAYKPLDLRDLKRTLSSWQKGLEGQGWNSLYLANHDQPRAVSRFGDDRAYRYESATMLATCLHMLQGTPYIYQGEEIGMTNVAFSSIDDYRDIETLNMYREFTEQRGLDPQAVLAMIHAKSRDNARTPMQWDASANAGFSSGTPWIKLNPNYLTINAAQDRADPRSIFAYYQQLIRLRKAHPIMVYGSYDLLLADDPQIYAFTRTLADERLLVLLNFSAATPAVAIPPEITYDNVALLIGNCPDAPSDIGGELVLRPYEARVYQLR